MVERRSVTEASVLPIADLQFCYVNKGVIKVNFKKAILSKIYLESNEILRALKKE